MFRGLLALVTGAALLAPASVGAQNEWQQQVKNYLERASQTYTQQGYRLTHDARTGNLAADASELVNIDLQRGRTYQIVGVCDNDCTDLDLRVYDSNGDELDHDIQQDDVPILTLTPSSTGTFTLAIFMWKCSTSNCYYGVGVYAR